MITSLIKYNNILHANNDHNSDYKLNTVKLLSNYRHTNHKTPNSSQSATSPLLRFSRKTERCSTLKNGYERTAVRRNQLLPAASVRRAATLGAVPRLALEPPRTAPKRTVFRETDGGWRMADSLRTGL